MKRNKQEKNSQKIKLKNKQTRKKTEKIARKTLKF